MFSVSVLVCVLFDYYLIHLQHIYHDPVVLFFFLLLFTFLFLFVGEGENSPSSFSKI